MRIAYFSEVFLPKVDGIVNTLCHVLDYLEQCGHASLLIAPEGAPGQYAATRIIPVPAAQFPLYPELRIANPLANLDNVLDQFQPDLVHVINPIALGIPGIKYARAHHLPLVASYHTDIAGFADRWGFGFLSEGLWSLLRAIHNQAHLNLCPSHATLRELEAHGFRNIKVWSRGVDTGHYHPGTASKEMRARLTDGHPQARLLVFVGRLSAEKRIDWLRDVLLAYPQTRLAIVGDGPYRATLEQTFQGLPVVFTGYLRGKELAAAYASSDLFVFPAANETFGNVILEAMACGLPVVAPRAGGPMDIVHPEENGLLFDPESIDSLIEQVGRLVENPGLASHFGRMGIKLAAKRTWENELAGLVAEYSGLAAEKNIPVFINQPTQKTPARMSLRF